MLFASTPQQPYQEQGDTNTGLQGPSFQPGLLLANHTLEFLENHVAFLLVSLLSQIQRDTHSPKGCGQQNVKSSTLVGKKIGTQEDLNMGEQGTE